MEIVELVSIDRQSAVGEDLKYGVEVSEDIAAQECVFVSSAEHIAPSECNVEHIVFSLKAEEGNVTCCSGGTLALMLPTTLGIVYSFKTKRFVIGFI